MTARRKILIVDDDDAFRRGLGLLLTSWGHAVVQAADGYYAVYLARNQQPDAVILDLGLPGGDGASVLERYVKNLQLSTIPVIVLSGQDPHLARQAVANYGVVAVLGKPADPEALAAALADAFARSGPAPSPVA